MIGRVESGIFYSASGFYGIKVSLLSSTVFTTDDVNISHSGVLGREFKRMKDRILLSTKIFIPAR